MKSLLALLLLSLCRPAFAQQFPIDTLRFHGDPSTHINIVILGDGYTASEQQTFETDAQGLCDYLLSQSPWSHYTSYFNFFAIEAPSQQSGTSHPNTAPDCAGSGVPTIAVSTRYGCSFDAFGIHRLVVPQNSVAIAQDLANNFPNYDQVLIVAHSPYYGGSGGAYATATTNSSSDEIVAHEIGHSFAGLADEYWAGPQYAAEKPNMTKQSSPTLIRWKNWLTDGSVGIYPHTGDPTWLKPSQTCKMQALGNPYCAVCSEAIIERIHALTNPIVAFSPKSSSIDLSSPITFSLDTIIAPFPNTLRTTWALDGSVNAQNTSSLVLDPAAVAVGTHTVAVAILDTSKLVRTDSHFTDHIHTVTWTVTKTNAIVVDAKQNSISLQVYPNPTPSELHVSTDCDNPTSIELSIVSQDGRVVYHTITHASARHADQTVDLHSVPAGAYTLILRSDGVSLSRGIVKE